MMRNKKGAWSFQQLGGIILVILVVLVVAINFIPRISKAAESGSKLFDAGDCDLDDVINSIDNCPCLSTGGLESSIRGCPLGTSPEESNLDKITCRWFATAESSCGGLGSSSCREADGTAFYSNCDGDNKEKCIQKSDKNFKTRCDAVSETAVGVTVKKGLAGNWDLIVSNLKLFDRRKGKTADTGTFDLENTHNSQPLFVNFDVENVGTQDTTGSFTVSVQVCNQIRQIDSCEAKISVDIGPLKYGEKKPFPLPTDVRTSLAVDIGSGDHCDGEGSASCSLRVLVDSTEVLGETSETNNDVWLPIWLQNKKSEKIDWVKKKSIEIFADEGEDPDYQSQIRATCEGFFGVDCETEDADCDDNGEFRSSLPPNGCLVHASEENDVAENDCGWAGAQLGFVLDHLSFKKIDLATGIAETEGDDNVGDLFTYRWQSTSEGSLVCGPGQLWHLCDSQRDGKILLVGGERFRCQQGGWKKVG